MIGKVSASLIDGHRESFIGQSFNGIGLLQIVLACARKARKLPCGNAVNQKWIAKRFPNLMAQRANVFNSAFEQSRRNPTGKRGQPDWGWSDSVIEKESMEAKRK